ncbi:TIGR02391 family protein [Tessaracoccus sp. Y1736]
MSRYGSDYLRRLVAAVEDFETAFEAWMQTQHESSHLESRGLWPTVATKEGQDPQAVSDLELRVAQAAGAAARAVEVTGAYLGVQGIGVQDPLSNWMTMRNPRAWLSPHEVRTTAATVKGRLASMISDAEAAADSDVPVFSPARLHTLIWSAAANHWTTHQYRVAVREAAEALNQYWKDRLDRHDVDDTKFWQETLSGGEPSPGKPKLVWPGDPESKTNKSMAGGLEPLAKALNGLATGLNLTIRNVTTHTRTELTEQEAMERLAAYSYLARILDQCQLRTASTPGAGESRST